MNPWRMRPCWLELSDRIVDFGPDGRRPVSRAHVLDALASEGNPYGPRILAELPVDARGDLDPDAVDRLLVACHRELQRLALELQQGPRTLAFLQPILARLPRPVRVVDVGCGIGYVLRWLAAHGGLGPGVELVGCDFNAALIEEARRLAEIEGLPVRFACADAFALEEPADVFLSTGVLHHVPADGLAAFFAAQLRVGAKACLHADFQASALARPGAWLFHRARMRQPLALHDGVLSAVRAHPAEVLLEAGRAAGGRVTRLGGSVLGLPRAMHTLLVEPP